MTNRTHILRAAVAAVLLSLTGALVALLLAPHATPMPVPVRPVAAPAQGSLQAPLARTPAADRDAAAEGRDTVVVRYERAPENLWAALRKAGYRGVPTDGCECLYVPVGTVVKVPGGLFVATFDGWSVCEDWTTTNAECSGPADARPVDDLAALHAYAIGDIELTELSPADQAAMLTPAQRTRYGTGNGAVCGTDAQCAAYSREVLHTAPSGYTAGH